MSTTKLKFDLAAGIRETPAAKGGMSSGTRVFTAGRNAKGRFAGWDAVRVTVTPLHPRPGGVHEPGDRRGRGRRAADGPRRGLNVHRALRERGRSAR